MPKYSIIVPVYNRPDELREFLESLTNQPFRDFEVIIVDDGSDIPAEHIVRDYSEKFTIRYFFKENSGPGDTRNFGMKQASAGFFLIFDSDCLIPPHYFEELEKTRATGDFDAFGGPDRSHPSFTAVQKAVSLVLTSWITTGGIRGKKGGLEKFNPRSFNMGIKKEVFILTGGFPDILLAEDTDLAIRMHNMGLKVVLVPGCWVYHKRRVNFIKFFRQMQNFGYGRVILTRNHPKSLKPVFLLPSLFLIYMVISILYSIVTLSLIALWPLIAFVVLIASEALFKEKNIMVSLLSIPAGFVQLTGYGLGFIKGLWDIYILKQNRYTGKGTDTLKKAM